MFIQPALGSKMVGHGRPVMNSNAGQKNVTQVNSYLAGVTQNAGRNGAVTMRSSFSHRESISGASAVGSYTGLAGSLGGVMSQERALSSLKSNVARYFAPRRAPRSKVLMSAHADGQVGDGEL